MRSWVRSAIDRDFLRQYLLWALLIAAATLPFAATIGYDLVWDDHSIVAHVENLSRDGGAAAVAGLPSFPIRGCRTRTTDPSFT